MGFKKKDKILVEGVVESVVDNCAPDLQVILNNQKLWVDMDKVHPMSESKWVPVEEGLPEEEAIYLVTTGDGEVRKCLYKNKTWCGHFLVIAWQPLPEPYKRPVKLRESCEGCQFIDFYPVYESGVKYYNGGGYTVCLKHKLAQPTPHLINGKPCHEVNND